MEETFNREIIIQDEHIQYPSLLLSGLGRVSSGLVQEYDAGIMALIALFGVLPAKVRKSFDDDIDELADIVKSEQYAERGTMRITRSVRSRYALKVYDCLARVTDALDKAGLLWKTKTELRGSEN
ncbi:hypothetical protein ACFLTP_01815 [Chloroflexota bacterium]